MSRTIAAALVLGVGIAFAAPSGAQTETDGKFDSRELLLETLVSEGSAETAQEDLDASRQALLDQGFEVDSKEDLAEPLSDAQAAVDAHAALADDDPDNDADAQALLDGLADDDPLKDPEQANALLADLSTAQQAYDDVALVAFVESLSDEQVVEFNRKLNNARNNGLQDGLAGLITAEDLDMLIAASGGDVANISKQQINSFTKAFEEQAKFENLAEKTGNEKLQSIGDSQKRKFLARAGIELPEEDGADLAGEEAQLTAKGAAQGALKGAAKDSAKQAAKQAAKRAAKKEAKEAAKLAAKGAAKAAAKQAAKEEAKNKGKAKGKEKQAS